MTNQLILSPLVKTLLATSDPSSVCLITDQPDDALLLSEQAGYHVNCAQQLPADLTHMRLLFVPIAREGFFDQLQHIDRSAIHVVAIVDDLAEEFVAAKFIGIQSALRMPAVALSSAKTIPSGGMQL